MSEFTASGGDYFRDNAPLLDDISGNVLLLAADAVSIVVNLGSESPIESVSGVPSVTDTLDSYPNADYETAVDILRNFQAELEGSARRDACALDASASMSQVAQRVQELKVAGVDDETLQEQIKTFQPVTAVRADWQQDGHQDEANDLEVTCTVLRLSDRLGNQFASEAKVKIEDSLTVRRVSINYFNGEPSGVDTSIEPIDDELLSRVIKTFGSEHVKIIALLMAGVTGDDSDVDAHLNNAWTDYQGTSKEQEVGPILDEVRDRYHAAVESRVLSLQFGTSQPNTQELIDLNAYLRQLLRKI